MVLDILANFNWDRPIYLPIKVGKDNFIGLEVFSLEGLAYRLVPYISNSADGQTGTIHTEIMYDNLINKFNWGGLNNSNLYFDPDKHKNGHELQKQLCEISRKSIFKRRATSDT